MSPPVVSVCKGILTAYSFLFFAKNSKDYAIRKYSCRGNRTVSRGTYLDVLNCARNKLTIWREDHFTVTKAVEIEEQNQRVAEMIAQELTKAKPGSWGCVQNEMWSTDEQVHLRPGHHWLFEFSDGDEGSNCQKLFSLPQRKTGVVYKGTRFYNGDRALRVKRWLHRVDEDAAGLTFEEWDPIKDADDSQTPVPMIINSSELVSTFRK